MKGVWIVFTLIYLVICLPQDGHSEQNIGCLFSDSVCDEQYEWCFDDYAFGRCLPLYGKVHQNDLYRYDLDSGALHTLEREMRRLFTLGYRWRHTYTQCVLNALLYTFRYDLTYDPSVCDEEIDQDLEGALRAIEGDEQRVDPRNLAYVTFRPSETNPHADFADEVYVPPIRMENFLADYADEDYPNYTDDYDEYFQKTPVYKKQPEKKSSEVSAFRERNTQKRSGVDEEQLMRLAAIWHQLKQLYQRQLLEEQLKEHIAEKMNEEAREVEAEERAVEQLTKADDDDNSTSPDDDDDDGVFGDRPARPVYTEGGEVFLPEVHDSMDGMQETIIPVGPQEEEEEFSNYAGDGYGPEDDDDSDELEALFTEALLRNQIADYPEDYPSDYDYPYRLNSLNYPEPDYSDYPDYPMENIPVSLREDFGFSRPERLDVKKPGPQYNVNNYAFSEDDDNSQVWKKEIDIPQLARSVALQKIFSTLHHRPHMDGEYVEGNYGEADMAAEDDHDSSEMIDDHKTSNNLGQKESPSVVPPIQIYKKEVARAAEPEDPQKFRSDVTTDLSADLEKVDTNYAYLEVNDDFNTWKEGAGLVEVLLELVGLPEDSVSTIRVESNQVTFKVLPNTLDINASMLAKEADRLKDKLSRETGMEVTAAGIGNKTKISAVPYNSTDHQLFVLTVVICGLVAAILLIVAALYIVKHHAWSRNKLRRMTETDTEASKDYQDLCRARMASKTQEKPEPVHVSHGRITSLSRDSDGSNNSPSSHSSTSSWSEEPVVTNMDISTGHMVLSYMEDHLKNKDRLEQEWVALCAYEAEPNSAVISQQAKNLPKNRFTELLPYDHSRVVLNDLANINGGDYINASTITDHDPRNPAYIATQGPLPETAADFWQMVWEQGSVVVVMLTKLTENGTALCHRYWPEEGSEVYHIYEIHLVSEHIWCDDYLVRSFYLKNLKTGETRTVTQFHFLSWPENGVPTSTKALLEFRRKVNKSYRGRSCPIVVHCSDGAGRTGTYCLIDMVLNRMSKGAKEIDIAATLEHIRDQRTNTVRTRQQFEFVLMAVAEEVHAILKALSQ